MSIADMCEDTVQIVTSNPTRGRSGGRVENDSMGPAKLCFVQAADASEIAKYDARGQQISHTVYFPEDPGLPASPGEVRLLWKGRYLSVLGWYSEGSPGEDLLWVANCQYQSTRQDA